MNELSLNLKKNESKTISLNTTIHGPKSKKDNGLTLVNGFANYLIDVTNKLKLDFNESDYNAQIRVLFKNSHGRTYIEKVNLFSSKNGFKPIDITEQSKPIHYFKQSIINEYLIERRA